MQNKTRQRHKVYLKTKVYIEKGVFKVHTFAFSTMIKAKQFIDKLHANGLITNP